MQNRQLQSANRNLVGAEPVAATTSLIAFARINRPISERTALTPHGPYPSAVKISDSFDGDGCI